LAVTDVGDAADLLRPVYDRTGGVDGYVSLEVNPHLANDTDGTIVEARRLFSRLNRPNIFIKVPATEAGNAAVETLIGEGVNVNVTLIFSLDAYEQVMSAYLGGLKRLAATGGEIGKVASVASFFVSRVDSAVDKKLQAKIAGGDKDLNSLLGKAAIGNAKLAFRRFKEVFHGEPFTEMRAKGGRVQRPLWASTSTKNPAYPDTYYVDTLIGAETVNTMPLKTIEAVKDHGTAAVTIEAQVSAYRDAIERIESTGISMKTVTGELLEAGVKAFADSFDDLMDNIRAKVTQLQTA
jgi:transaldolase